VESFQPTDFLNRYALMPADATARTVNMCNIQHWEKADLTPGGAKRRSFSERRHVPILFSPSETSLSSPEESAIAAPDRRTGAHIREGASGL